MVVTDITPEVQRTRLDVLPGVDRRRRPSLARRSKVLVAAAVVISMLTVVGWSLAFFSIRSTTDWLNKTATPISQETGALMGNIEATVGSVTDLVIEAGQEREISVDGGDAQISGATVIANASNVRVNIGTILSVASTSADNPATQEIIDATVQLQQAFTTWETADALPTVEALTAGNIELALATTRSDEAWGSYLAMMRDVDALARVVADEQDVAVRSVDRVTMLMGGSAVLVTVLGMLVTGVYAWNLRSLVVHPMRRMALEIDRVTDEGNYHARVTPTGPEELHTMGSQIEYLRRSLVSEIDERRSAYEALETDAPCAVAMSELLRPTPYVTVNEFEIEVYHSAAEGLIPADWWTAQPLTDGSTLFAVVDVSGHSAAAGVVAYGALARCNAAARHSSDIQIIAEATQSHLQPHQKNMFMCAFLAKVTPTLDGGCDVQYINAGGLTAAVRDIRATGVRLTDLPATHAPLWVGHSGETQMEPTVIHLHADSALVVASDGISDVRNSAGERFGVDKFLHALQTVPSATLPEVVEGTISAIREYSSAWNSDDITVAALARRADTFNSEEGAGR